ncbi:MAG: phosphatase PAP2 family protein [Anaerolineae bacterium]
MRGLKRHATLVVLTWLAAGFGLLWLAGWVTAVPVTPVDLAVSTWVQQHFSAFGRVLEFVCIFGFFPASQLLSLGIALVLWLFSLRRAAVVCLFTLSSGLISSSIKMLVDRPRPADDLVTIVRHLDDASFPSGHVTMYTVIFGYLLFVLVVNKRLPLVLRMVGMILSLFMLLTVGISRMYLGAHWVTDVMGGHLIGLSVLSLLIAIYGSQQILPRFID